jgi:hypothetical protein
MEPIPLFNNEQINIQANNSLCSICLTDLQQQENNTHIIPECGHSFHSNCLIEWLRIGDKSCPMCRGVQNNRRRTSPNILNMLIAYSKRKNASKNLTKLVNKYKKVKIAFDSSNKKYVSYKKKHKTIIKEKNKLWSKKWSAERKLNLIKHELLSIPIDTVKITKNRS